ncbi:MAG: hypothetical protein ATN35_00645 [Epulopiscium sp. Nele67-Bin004]|nr:MAG: hypothetical protein ATN35_00645 [Epulopiscium sp. Nele67-Bin004]
MIKKIFLGIAIPVVSIAAGRVYLQERPSTTFIDPMTYFSEFVSGQQNMTYEDTRISMIEPVIIKDDVIYVSNEFASLYIDDAIFYDSVEDILTITNAAQVIRMNIGDAYYTINGEEHVLDFAIFERNETAYIPESYLEANYPISFELGEDERLVVATDLQTSKQLAKVTGKNVVIRTHPDKKQSIVDTLATDSVIEVYGEEVDGYYRVRNENGMIGYVDVDDVTFTGKTEVQTAKVYEPYPVSKPLNDKVKLVWDQMVSEPVHDLSATRYKNIGYANVISPTWFEFADDQGNLTNRGSTSYVQQAHALGLQVWPLISHNFVEWQWTREILTSTEKRQNLIDNLITYATTYGVDGINIDIENVAEDFSDEWVQFMRELYPQLGALGLTVSVDIYIPSAWSAHYQRDKIGEVVDYFIVMAYDQHWSGSDEAGPVAAIPWVEEGILLNLQEVPSDKLVMGIPFYNRVWAETEDGLETVAVSMYEANSRISSAGAQVVYDPETKLNYAEFNASDKLYKIWLEDAWAIELRLEIIDKYDLAGYAGWKLGLETSDVWDKLSQFGE